MDALECIEQRISMRKFKSSEMKDEEVEAIIKAGFAAPSAMNKRPYELIINRENDFWKDFSDVKPTCEIARNCPLTILIVGDATKQPFQEFMIEDCATVAQNMLLAAKAYGYDSLWAGVKFDSEFFNKLIGYFQLPKGFYPIAMLMFGKGLEQKKQVDRYDESKIHLGKF